MRKLLLFVLTITLLALPAACGDRQPETPGPETAAASSDSVQEPAPPGEKESASPEDKPAPLVVSPEELLSAAEASALVGQPVTASFDPTEVSDTGEASGTYIYDLPHEGIDTADTILAKMYLIQNGLISPSELEKGHDARWAFEGFQKMIPDKIVKLSGLGGDAFYVTDNNNVHVLFQDYYILVAFVKDSVNDAANLELNKSIAAFIVDKLSLADVSLTSPE